MVAESFVMARPLGICAMEPTRNTINCVRSAKRNATNTLKSRRAIFACSPRFTNHLNREENDGKLALRVPIVSILC